MSVYELCEQAVGLVRGKRLILTEAEKRNLEALNYEALTSGHAQDEAVVCALHFGRVRDRLLQLYAWSFARKSAEVEGGGSLPADCMTVLCVMQDGTPVDYEISGGKLNTSAQTEIHYTAKITAPDEWSAAFRDVFVYSLAVEICAAVTGKAEYAQILEQKAQELIQRAYQAGAIQTETRITLKQEIFNRAIGLVRGHRTPKPTSESAVTRGIDTAGISEWRTEAEINACIRSYEAIRDRLLKSYAWKFAMKTAALAQKTENVSGWCYTYALPTDCARVWNVISKDKTEIADYEVSCNELYSDVGEAYARYVMKVNKIEDLAPEFVEVYVYLLAAEVSLNVTDDVRAAQYFEQKALALIENARMSGLIKEHTGLPVHKGKRYTGMIGRPYLDYSLGGFIGEVMPSKFCCWRD